MATRAPKEIDVYPVILIRRLSKTCGVTKMLEKDEIKSEMHRTKYTWAKYIWKSWIHSPTSFSSSPFYKARIYFDVIFTYSKSSLTHRLITTTELDQWTNELDIQPPVERRQWGIILEKRSVKWLNYWRSETQCNRKLSFQQMFKNSIKLFNYICFFSVFVLFNIKTCNGRL